MPERQKQKTGVKKKNKARTKTRTRTRRPNEPVLVSVPEKQATKQAVIDEAAGAWEENVAAEPVETLEMQQVESGPAQSEIEEMEEYADISEESANIMSIVKDLEGQVETAFKLKEVMEANLDATQKKLSEAFAARAELEVQIKSLEARTAGTEQLREDLHFADEERNKFASLVADIQLQLEAITQERDLLAEEMSSVKAQARELESERTAFEAQVLNLKDKVTETEHLQTMLTEETVTRRDLREHVRDLSSQLEASEASNSTRQETVRNLREEIKELQGKLTDADSRLVTLGVQLEEQQVVNADFLQIRARLENEIKTLNLNYNAAKNELQAFKKALHDIRSEANRTSGRVSQRYSKPKGKG